MTNTWLARGMMAAAGVASATLLTAPAMAEDTQVRIGYSTLFNTGFHLYMADVAPEFYNAHGLDVRPVDMRANAANCIAALLSNDVDMCSVSAPTGVFAGVEGAPIKAVAVLQGPLAEIFVTSAAAEATGVAIDAPVNERVAALEGMSLVTSAPGTLYYNMLEQMFRDADMSMSAISYRTLVDQVAMREGLANNSFQSALWSGGAFADLEATDQIVSWISVPRGDLPALAELPTVTVFASETWLANNPGKEENLHAAFVDIIAALRAEPERYSRDLKNVAYEEMDDTIWDAAYAVGIASLWETATATEQGWNDLLDMQKSNNPDADFSAAAFETMVLPVARGE
ncbi:MAG: ABC transporter substrate-binding protein [Paracoccaceae bacterium]